MTRSTASRTVLRPQPTIGSPPNVALPCWAPALNPPHPNRSRWVRTDAYKDVVFTTASHVRMDKRHGVVGRVGSSLQRTCAFTATAIGHCSRLAVRPWFDSISSCRESQLGSQFARAVLFLPPTNTKAARNTGAAAHHFPSLAPVPSPAFPLTGSITHSPAMAPCTHLAFRSFLLRDQAADAQLGADWMARHSRGGQWRFRVVMDVGKTRQCKATTSLS